MNTANAATDSAYDHAIQGEGEFWDNFIAQRLLRGEIPGSIDWRLTFTQFRHNHNWRPFCLGAPGINFRMEEMRYILATAAPRPGMRVLDLGCGAGWLSLELARRGAHVTALDISPTNLALGRYMVETNARNFPYLYQGLASSPCRLEEFGSVEYVYSDLNTVNLPSNEYDAVVVWDSLHHVAELERLLEQVRGALKPGGIFLGVDHAFASPQTEMFNKSMLPWLDDFYSWVTKNDPQWLYEGANVLGRHFDLGVLNVDYDATPVPGFDPFLKQLLGEVLDVIRQNTPTESTEPAAQEQHRSSTGAAQESPFEDVSSQRLARVLLETFQAERFTTICPFITPEAHVPMYRSESERIFQHYLAALITKAGQRAVERKEADGQWFLFHLMPDHPNSIDQVALAPGSAIGEANSWEALANTWASTAEERLVYIRRLESELARKNKAISSLEARRQRDAALITISKPRLPWKQKGSHKS